MDARSAAEELLKKFRSQSIFYNKDKENTESPTSTHDASLKIKGPRSDIDFYFWVSDVDNVLLYTTQRFTERDPVSLIMLVDDEIFYSHNKHTACEWDMDFKPCYDLLKSLANTIDRTLMGL